MWPNISDFKNKQWSVSEWVFVTDSLVMYLLLKFLYSSDHKMTMILIEFFFIVLSSTFIQLLEKELNDLLCVVYSFIILLFWFLKHSFVQHFHTLLKSCEFRFVVIWKVVLYLRIIYIHMNLITLSLGHFKFNVKFWNNTR